MARASLRFITSARFIDSLCWAVVLVSTIGLLVFLIALMASPASAADCRQFFVQKQYAYAQPVVAAYAYPAVQYLAGQDIQAEALAEKVARLVDKKLELRQQQRQTSLPVPAP